eukprot:scaffold85443_cov43-Phaeocystis_antarctica.AAC.1
MEAISMPARSAAVRRPVPLYPMASSGWRRPAKPTIRRLKSMRSWTSSLPSSSRCETTPVHTAPHAAPPTRTLCASTR